MLHRLFIASVILLSLIAAYPLHAQSDFYIGAEIGYATFTMKNLREYQENQKYSLAVPAKTVANFPSYLQYAFNFTGQRKSFLYGASVGHTSTGGRITYSDYSGSLSIDNLVTMNYIGGTAAWRIENQNGLRFYAGFNLSFYLNKLTTENKEIMGELTVTDHSTEYHSSNLAIGPYVEAQKHIGRFMFRAQASYEFHFAGELHYLEDGINYTASTSSASEVNGSGLRLKAGVNFRLNRNSHLEGK